MANGAALACVQVLALKYAETLKDPIAAVARVYAAAGLSFDAATEEMMRAHLAASPQHKEGRPSYSLEKFGLDAAMVDAKFKAYNEAFL